MSSAAGWNSTGTSMAEYLFKLTQNQQQLKQRQIDDLKREIKELQQHAAGLTREKEQ